MQGPRQDTLLSIWARRAASIPAYVALTLLVTSTAPLWVLGALAADALAGQVRVLPRTRALAFVTFFLWCELAGIAAAFAIWLGALAGARRDPRRFLEANAALQRWWTGALFQGGVRLFSIKVEVEGLELARRGPLLLFVRHSSSADTVLTAALVANPNRLLLRYVLKRELLWDPCLDIVGRRLPNAFVDRRAPRAEAEIAAVAELARDLDERSAVLIYPEGTRFSEEKRSRAVAGLRDKGKDALAELAAGFRSVLPPKLGGPLALLDAAPGVDLVLVEHEGFEGAASLSSFWRGALVGRTLRVRLRRFAANDIPRDGRDRWLFERWAEVDRWLPERRA